MANRYWVGGTNSWNNTAGTKWSATSGGAGGAAVPTSADDVFFDANSGAVTVTVTSARVCRSLNFTGFNGTFAGSSAVTISGSLNFGSTATFTHGGNLVLSGTITGRTITSNGKTVASTIAINTGASATVTLADALNTTRSLFLQGGVFSTGNFNITCSSFVIQGTATKNISLGSSTITVTGDLNPVAASSTGLTFNAGTSLIRITSALTAERFFTGGGLIFNNVWNDTSGAFAIVVQGSNTFNDFKISAGRKQKFAAGTTQTVTTFTVPNNVGNAITIESSSTTQHNLSCSSGTITVKGCTISNSNATGGATWNSLLSDSNVNGGNNTGWNFGSAAVNTNGFFAIL